MKTMLIGRILCGVILVVNGFFGMLFLTWPYGSGAKNINAPLAAMIVLTIGALVFFWKPRWGSMLLLSGALIEFVLVVWLEAEKIAGAMGMLLGIFVLPALLVVAITWKAVWKPDS